MSVVCGEVSWKAIEILQAASSIAASPPVLDDNNELLTASLSDPHVDVYRYVTESRAFHARQRSMEIIGVTNTQRSGTA